MAHRFVDSKGRLCAAGMYETKNVKAVTGKTPQVIPPSKEQAKAVAPTTDTTPMTPLQALAKSDIPTEFPMRQELILGGVSTIADLKSEGVKARIEAIKGISAEDVIAIGVAISELK